MSITAGLLRVTAGGRLLASCQFLAAAGPSSSVQPINNQQQCRTLKHKSVRPIDPTKTPPPWPYREKGYRIKDEIQDFTKKRLTESSKLIVVEGNIGTGKSELARQLAEELDFYYIPTFTPDKILVNSYGVDLRDYYHIFPPSCRLPDLKMYYENPTDLAKVARMQDHIYFGKHESYCNALAHIFNTGQGVVMDRSPHSDFVFVNAMREKNFLTEAFFRFYHYQRKITLNMFNFHPHLVVYLDSPPDVCMDRIKKRGIPYENNGKVIDYQYLDTIRESYKDLLQEYDPHSYILSYDWSKAADVDQVVEDIENLDLDFFEWHSGDRLEAWVTTTDPFVLNRWRYEYTEKYQLKGTFEAMEKYEVEDLFISEADVQQYISCLKKFVYGPYVRGYNRELGDPLWPMIFNRENRDRVDAVTPWYEHYYKDCWHSQFSTYTTFTDPHGELYDPDYNEAAAHH